MRFHFTKMHGCGNDFLFLDYMKEEEIVPLNPAEVVALCHRQFGLGADGLVILGKSRVAHARWFFFNSDGSEAEMCGNAARCAVRLLSERYFPEARPLTIETEVGIIKGTRLEGTRAEVTLLPHGIKEFNHDETVLKYKDQALHLYIIDTGVPHAVLEVEDINNFPIEEVGRFVLKHDFFKPEETNVTFFEKRVGNHIWATTFERGVEKQTFACGTGAAAASLIYSHLYLQPLPIHVTVPGGEFTVAISDLARMLLLQGDTQIVYDCELDDLTSTFEPPRLYGQRETKK